MTVTTSLKTTFWDGNMLRASVRQRLGDQVATDGWKPFFMVALFVYLVFELAFNASLLDAVGTRVSQEELHSVESWGRIISGIAFALGLHGFILLPLMTKARTALPVIWLVLALVSAGSIYGMYQFQAWLVASIVEHSSGEERQRAMWLTTLNSALQSGDASLKGIELDSEVLSSPQGKAFTALMPFAAGGLVAEPERLLPHLRVVARREIEVRAGDAGQFFDTSWRESAKGIIDGWNGYVDGVKRRNNLLADLPNVRASAWQRYTESLQRNRLRPGNVPGFAYSRVRSEVRSQGVPVSDNWNPNDRAGFMRAVDQKAIGEADQAFRNATQDKLGTALPPTLEFEEFLARREIQDKWYALLGQSEHRAGRPILDPRMDFDTWLAKFWNPTIDRAVQQLENDLFGQAADYADGGSKEDVGRSAMELLIAPPLALMFSMAGAFIHLFKSFNMAGGLMLPFWRWRPVVLGSILLCIAALPFALPNNVSASPVFQKMVGSIAETQGQIAATGVQWVVQAQPMAYPVSHALRSTILLGYNFGMAPR